MPYEREERRNPRQLSEQDVERIAEEVFERELQRHTLASFERMDLLTKEGKADWKALAAPSKWYSRRTARLEKFYGTIYPFLLLGGLGLVLSKIEQIWSMLGAIIMWFRGGH